MNCLTCNQMRQSRRCLLNLKSLGKTLTNEEMIRKILLFIPKRKRGPKVIAIEEALDFSTLALDDLIEKFLTHEIHLMNLYFDLF